MRKIASSIFAYPGGTKFMCKGTLSFLKNAICSINNVSMVLENKGRTDFSRKEICNIKKPEAKRDTWRFGNDQSKLPNSHN
jgi:hypothetical protein